METLNRFQKMLIADLRQELTSRGVIVTRNKRTELEREFEELKCGIDNFPVLLEPNPQATLQLQQYEVAPAELLHDLKGCLIIIDETIEMSSGKVLDELMKIKSAVLNKEAIRCSDIRKDVLLMYIKLTEVNADRTLIQLVSTAAELCELCYSHEYSRSPKRILYLYNVTFLHAHFRTKLFSSPKTMTRRKEFGRYFHSIANHVPTIISLRSVNSEQQERMFAQSKAITRTTTNYHGQHVIDNILHRVQVEQQVDLQNVLAHQKSEIKAISQALGPQPNKINGDLVQLTIKLTLSVSLTTSYLVQVCGGRRFPVASCSLMAEMKLTTNLQVLR